MGSYEIKDNRPLNPKGRTGLKGRGVLGKWGPNHAADPIVTRWKRSEALEKVLDASSNKSVLCIFVVPEKNCLKDLFCSFVLFKGRIAGNGLYLVVW